MRLHDCAWIVARIDHLQQEYEGHPRWDVDGVCRSRQPEPSPERVEQIFQEVSILSETFYYFAWRCRDILADRVGCRSFMPTGIRQVRNPLIEHAQVASRRFVFGQAFGPIILRKGAVEKVREGRRKELREIEDKGLYDNAREFLEDLVALFTRGPLSKGVAE